jgi:hypothetical protein
MCIYAFAADDSLATRKSSGHRFERRYAALSCDGQIRSRWCSRQRPSRTHRAPLVRARRGRGVAHRPLRHGARRRRSPRPTVRQVDAEVLIAALVTDACALLVGGGEVKRQRVAATRRPEEHDRPITEQLLQGDCIPVQGNRSIVVGDEQVNMSDSYRVHGPSPRSHPPSAECAARCGRPTTPAHGRRLADPPLTRRTVMTAIKSITTTTRRPESAFEFDEARVAAGSFLALQRPNARGGRDRSVKHLPGAAQARPEPCC